jgi:hypothetical protein
VGDTEGSAAAKYARGVESNVTFLGFLASVVLAAASFYGWGYIESAPLRARHTECPWFGGPLPRHIAVAMLLTSAGAGLVLFITRRKAHRLRVLIPLCVLAFVLVGMIDLVALFHLGGGGECYD